MFAVLTFGPTALAQENAAAPPPADDSAAPPPADAPPSAEPPAGEPPSAEPPSAEPPAEAPGSTPSGAQAEAPPPATTEAAPTPTNGWQDISVVPRRAVLKRRRVEIMPTYNISLNNPMVHHNGFGAMLNVYLSEALFIGLEGTYYRSQLLDRYFLVGLDQRVLPSVNQYDWSALVNFGYIPVHGKFSLFNSAILHWESWIQAGVGAIQTEIIPRDPATNGFTTITYAFDIGVGARTWVNRWFAIDVYFKGYLFDDQLEPNVRTPHDCDTPATCTAQQSAVSQFTVDAVFGVGLSILLPPGFEYKGLR